MKHHGALTNVCVRRAKHVLLYYFRGRAKWIETNHKASCPVCLKLTCP